MNEEQKQERAVKERQLDVLTELIDILSKDNLQFMKIATSVHEINKQLFGILEQIEESVRLVAKLMEQLEKITNEERPEAGQAVDEVSDSEGPVTLPVHGMRYPDKRALCGAQGSAAQPFAGRKNEKVTSHISEITCPECFDITAWNQKILNIPCVTDVQPAAGESPGHPRRSVTK